MRRMYITVLIITFFVGGSFVMLGKEKSFEREKSNKTDAQYEKAIFAGGCFWCMEGPFESLEGVSEVVSGYAGGSVENPSYRQVSGGRTGHREAIQITFDPQKISYKELVEVFWRQIDPTDTGGQFADRGFQYSTAIFYTSEEQRRIAQESKEKLDAAGKFTKPIATEIVKATNFYRAEEYHQDYYKKNAADYKRYRIGSGRQGYLKETWASDNTIQKNTEAGASFSKPTQKQLRITLTPLQYYVTQENGTEPPFKNEFWNNREEGIYVDVVSGEPLFASSDKFKSGTGWPSFVKPLVAENIIEKKDVTLGMVRTEVRSKHADSHLGHVFNDGPPPTGLRYCINSAALRFIPKERLEAEGYGEFQKLFK